jgi:hypothetical protein
MTELLLILQILQFDPKRRVESVPGTITVVWEQRAHLVVPLAMAEQGSKA